MGVFAGVPSCAAKAPGTAAVAGAKPAQPLVTAPLKDPLAQGFKATAVIGISCKVRGCPWDAAWDVTMMDSITIMSFTINTHTTTPGLNS